MGAEWSGTKDANKDVQAIILQVKAQAEGKTNKKYLEFHAVEYKTLGWTGTNYLIKVHAGLDNYLHLMVSQAYNGGAVVLTAVQEHHDKEDPLVPF